MAETICDLVVSLSLLINNFTETCTWYGNHGVHHDGLQILPEGTDYEQHHFNPSCYSLGYTNPSSVLAKKAALLSREMRPFILKVNQPELGDFLLWQHDSPPLPECAPSPCR